MTCLRRASAAATAAILGLALGFPLGARAIPPIPVVHTYTNRAAFLVALPGTVVTQGFEQVAAGTALGSGSGLDGLLLAHSATGHPMLVTDAFSQTTPSGTHSLGLAVNDKAFLSGNTVSIGFSTSVVAFGLNVIGSPDDVEAGDLVLTAGSTSVTNYGTPGRVLADGGEAFFLGIYVENADPGSVFTNASLTTTDPGTNGLLGVYVYDLDDLTYPVVPLAEIDVLGSGQSIADGDTSPDTPDGTDFGTIATNGAFEEHTFTITNAGLADIVLDPATAPNYVSLSGADAADFSVTLQPAATTPADGHTDFTVRFTPSALGTRTATLSFAHNDGDETPYDFAVQGTGLVVANSDPTDIALSEDTVAENKPTGTVVGTFSTTDPDAGDSHTYSLVAGTGGDDNASFSIDGNQLKTVEVFDYETQSSYAIRVEADDGNGGTYEEPFTITVTDASTPLVVGPSDWTVAGLTLVVDGGMVHLYHTGGTTDAVPPWGPGDVSPITITGRDGDDDELIIDYSGGDPLPAGGVSYEGGAGGNDTLTITGGAFAAVTHACGNANDGAVGLDGKVITYTGLEPVDMTGSTATDFIFNLPAGADNAELSHIGGGTLRLRSTDGVPTFESTDFAPPSGSITINGGTGTDTLAISGAVTTSCDFAVSSLEGGINLAAGSTLDLGGNNFDWAGGTNVLNVTAGGILQSFGAITDTAGDNTINFDFGTLGTGAENITVDAMRINPFDPDGGLTYTRGGGTLTVNGVLQLGGETSGGGNNRGNLTQNGGAVIVGGDLLFGGVATGNNEGGTYDLNGGTLNVAGDILEGASGAPNTSIDQAQLYVDDPNALTVGGNISVQSFRTGDNQAGSHTVLAGKQVVTTGTLLVGRAAVGTMIIRSVGNTAANMTVSDAAGGAGSRLTLDGGTLTVNGGTDIGDANGSAGTLDITGGGVWTNTANVSIGQAGTGGGQINVTDGSLTITGGGLNVAGDGTGDGNTTGAVVVAANGQVTVVAGNTEVGRGGTGSLTIDGGTFDQKASNLVLSQTGGSGAGTVTVNGGTVNIGDGAGQNTDINFNGGTGPATFDHNGGDVFVERDIQLGGANSAASRSYYTLDAGAGSLTVGDDIYVGKLGHGEFNIESGTFSIGGQLHIAGDDASSAARANADGTVNIGVAGGNPTIDVNQFEVGDQGLGAVNHSNGTMNVNGANNLVIGQVSAGNGTYNLDGGTLFFNSGAQGELRFNAGTGVFNQTGGLVDINGNRIAMTSAGSGNATYNLQGGTLDLGGGTIVGGAGTEAFNFTGGTMKDVGTFGFALAQGGGILQLGADTAADSMTVSGAFGQTAGNLEIDIDGAAGPGAAGGHDQLIVNGTVTLGGDLDIALGYAPSGYEPFIIVDNDGADGVSGTFNGRPEGDLFTLSFGGSPYSFTISYAGGDGNDVVLAASPRTIYVDDSFTQTNGAAIADADVGTTGNQPATMGTTAFTNITAALGATAGNDIIVVNGGTYAETVALGNTRMLEVTGPDAAQAVLVDALSGSAGTTVTIEGASTLTVGDAANQAVAGLVEGSGSLVKRGSGILTLSGANTYTGDTTVAEGTIAVGHASALGTSEATINNGGVLNLGGFNVANDITIGGGTLSTQNGISGTITLNSGGTNTINAVGNYRLLSGRITGAGGFTFGGSSVPGLTLSNPANDFQGDITINGGAYLRLDADEVIPDTASVTANGSLRLEGDNRIETIAGLSGGGRVFAVNGGGGPTLRVGSGNATSTHAGPIGQGGANNRNIHLVKIGAGTLALNGASDYTGGTTISEGTLVLGNNAAAGTATITLCDTNSGAADVALYATGNVDPGNAIVVANQGTGTVRIGANGTDTLNNIFSGSVQLNRAATLTGDADRTSFSGIISGNPGTVTIERSPDLTGGTPGRMTWEQNNTFDGDVEIKALARLQVGGGGGADQIPLGANVDIETGGFLWLVFDDESINGLTGGGTATFYNGGGLGATTLTVGEGNTPNAQFDGLIQDAGGTAMNLVKVGAGTQILTGAGTYTGTTTVNGGTLQVDNASGSATGGGTVGVNAGATLSGSGAVAGAVTLTGGTVAPRLGLPEDISTGALSLDSASTYPVQINGAVAGTGHDQLAVTGGVNLDSDAGSGATLTPTLGYVPGSGDTFVIIDNDGADAVGGTFDGMLEGHVFQLSFGGNSYPFHISYAGGDGNDVEIGLHNLAPIAVNDTTGIVVGASVVVDALANDSDADGDPLTITNVTQGTQGSVVINAGGSNVTYTSTTGVPGNDTFTYWVSDGQGGWATGLVTVAVDPLVTYVSAAGSNTWPYADWSMAAHTIQTAVDAVAPSGTVWVTNGTYSAGGATVDGMPCRVALAKPVTVRSVNGKAVTTIVGQGPVGFGAVRCLYMIDGASLSGFTLQDGATRGFGNEDGIINRSVPPPVHIAGIVEEQQSGGGVRLHNGGVLSNCVVRGNSAFVRGGGVWCDGGGMVYGCTIVSNAASLGGGASLHDGSLIACYIMDNVALTAGGGGHSGSPGLFRNCLIVSNSAPIGGGVSLVSTGAQSATVQNCTIASNTATLAGGGLNCNSLQSPGPAVVNTIIYYNSAPVSQNWVNIGPVVYTNACTTPTNGLPGPGHIASEPLFSRIAGGGYHLRASSPCKNTGLNDAWMTGDADIEGNARIIAAIVDRGAYEYPNATDVVLYSFWLQQADGQVVVHWQTASEVGTVGFQLYRKVGGDWVLVNTDGLIPAKGAPLGGIGASYSYVDSGANPSETHTYRLVEITLDGTEEYGPFERSAFELRLVSPLMVLPDGGVAIRWLSRPGDVYRVYSADSILRSFEPLSGALPATPPENVYTDRRQRVGTRYYQVRMTE